MTTIRYLGNDIQLTEDGSYRPNRLIINGEPATMDAYSAEHGYSWRTSASGNVLCYRAESGSEYSIPQARLQETFQDDLREAMEAAGLNLKQAAELCGVPYRTMQDWRAGRRTPANIVKDTVLDRLAAK